MNEILRTKLRELLIEDGELEPYAFTQMKDWPEIPAWDWDENTEDEVLNGTEPLDCENCSLINITENTVSIVCGGDWQEPYDVTIGINTENELSVFTVQETTNEWNEVPWDTLELN